MSHATLYIGDVFEVMATLPDDSVDLILTSPPFLALRSYLPADHPDKAKEIGSEATPAEFLDTLLALTAEWGRLIGPYGSICVELGDTYAGSSMTGGDWKSDALEKTRYKKSGEPPPANAKRQTEGWPLDKSLYGIPHLYHLSLAYGRNLLTGQPSPAGQWRVRNVVAWCRPNPAVGALGDKFRPATSYMTIATKARDRWFDLDAVRSEVNPANARPNSEWNTAASMGSAAGPRKIWRGESTGAPPLDWWEISTEAYAGSHYATWPRKLLERPIKAMCPSEVCRQCGEPRRRIVEASYERNLDGGTTGKQRDIAEPDGRTNGTGHTGKPVMSKIIDTLGWTDCGHDDYRHGIVLDPFGGSGTTAVVATGHGRDCILIDLDDRNEHLVRERVGMFLTVVEPDAAA